MDKENSNVRELRVRDFPVPLHDKIEKYISKVHSRTGRRLNKQTATIELVEKATKDILI
jgi:hypothetical protein